MASEIDYNSRKHKIICWIDDKLMDSMGWVFLGSIFGTVFFLDWLLEPEIQTVKDEGIYFGYLVVSIPVSLVVLFLYVMFWRVFWKVLSPKKYFPFFYGN